MVTHTRSVRRAAILLVVTLVVLSAGPGLALAEFSGGGLGFTGIAGTVVVEEGQTVDQVTGIAGSIIVRGTVTGDVSGLAGDVVVAETGTVQGDLSVASGSLRIAGNVGGSVSAGAGNVVVTPSGTVGQDLSVGAGNVEVAGRIGGDATIGADTIALQEGAVIAGGLRYDGDLQDHPAAVVQGPVVLDESLGGGMSPDRWTAGVWQFPAWADSVYGFVANLVLGAILLLLFPTFSRRVAERVAETPARSGALGFVGLVGAPVLLVLLAITIIGIPIAILGVFVYMFAVWTGLVYGEFAVGHWLLARSSADVNRWYALLLGLLLFTVLGFIPVLGDILAFFALIVGLGALGSSVRGAYRRRRGAEPTPTDATTGSGSDASAA